MTTIAFPLLGLDYGKKYCGFAWSPDGVCALPLGIFPTSELRSHLFSFLDQKNIKILVCGLPVSANNHENSLCQTIRQLGAEVANHCAVAFVNERYSTQSLDLRPKSSRVDDLSAIRILEFYLAGSPDLS